MFGFGFFFLLWFERQKQVDRLVKCYSITQSEYGLKPLKQLEAWCILLVRMAGL